jgi:hypothetical protein
MTVEIKEISPKMTLSDIPVGTIFTGKIGGYPDKLMFKAKLNLVYSLDPVQNPLGSKNAWYYDTTYIEGYKKVKRLIAEV